jgi:hypothetical protein
METLLRATGGITEEFVYDCRADATKGSCDEGMVAFYR